MPFIAKHLSNFTQREIKALFKKGMRTYKSPEFDIIIMPSPCDFGRILVVTPRKIGTAPKRNQVRRRLKALFYQMQWYQYKYDLCVIIKPAGINYTSKQFETIMRPLVAALPSKT